MTSNSNLIRFIFVIVVTSIISFWQGWATVLLINMSLLLAGGIFLMLRARYHDYSMDTEKQITKLDQTILGFTWLLLCVGTLVIFVLSLGESWETVLLINASLVLGWIVIIERRKIFHIALSYIKKARSH